MNTSTLNQPTEQTYMGTITWANMSGDVTIAWTEENRERILEVVRKKMAEGYTFFTTKKFMFKKLTRKVKITEKNIEQTEEIIITDAQFEKMCVDMNDNDVATLVRNDKAAVVKRDKKETLECQQILKNAEDVLDKKSIALRPMRGG